MSNPKIQQLIDSINRYAVDPETVDFSMKTIACRTFTINGEGDYSPQAERNKHIYKEFLSDGFYSNDPNLKEHFEEIWVSYLVRRYYDAIFETGAIPVGSISTISDYAIAVDSIDMAVWKYELKGISRDKQQSAKIDIYTNYLQWVLNNLEEANNKRKDKSPVKILWESQLNSYMLKHTSLGGGVAKPVIGPNGAVRRPLPWTDWQKMLDAIGEMVARCPSRVINTKTKTYSNIKGLYNRNNREMGYANIDEFFDAYGFSTK